MLERVCRDHSVDASPPIPLAKSHSMHLKTTAGLRAWRWFLFVPGRGSSTFSPMRRRAISARAVSALAESCGFTMLPAAAPPSAPATAPSVAPATTPTGPATRTPMVAPVAAPATTPPPISTDLASRSASSRPSGDWAAGSGSCDGMAWPGLLGKILVGGLGGASTRLALWARLLRREVRRCCGAEMLARTRLSIPAAGGAIGQPPAWCDGVSYGPVHPA